MVDRAERIEHATTCRVKMAECLAEAWQKGERRLVRDTITGALNPQMREQWRDDAAALLPETERAYFIRFMDA